MPVAIDSGMTNRPGSVNSVPSPNTTGIINMNATMLPVRPTTTSRRGGRSRSPVAALGRPLPDASSNNNNPSNSTSSSGNNNNAAGDRSSSAGNSSHTNNNAPGDDETPSSAAAAAAAAAKAYSTTGRAPGPWPHHHHHPSSQSSPPPPGGPHDDAAHSSSANRPPPPSQYGGSEASSSSNWPENGYRPHRHAPPFPGGRDTDYGDSSSSRRYPPPPHHHHHPRDAPPRYEEHPSHHPHPHHPHHPPPHHRYGGPPPPHHRGGMPVGGPPPPHYLPPHPPPPSDYHRYSSSSGSSRPGPPPPPPHHQHHPHHPQFHSRGQPPSSSSHHRPPEHHRNPYHSGGGGGSSSHHREAPPRVRDRSDAIRTGTTLVLGGPTPIHLPKSPLVSSSSSAAKLRRQPPCRDGSASSVFRGRPEIVPSPNPDDENSPQKILLSLRTPTTSFEELKDKSSLTKKLKPTDMLLSDPSTPSPPEQSQNAIFLEQPQRSGEGSKADGSIDIAPSFNIFNQSFDSFGDAQYFNIDSTLNADSFGLAQTESLVGNDVGTQQVLRENPSGGNFLTQYLVPSGSGALTIGYSPVNSFGNVSSAVASRHPKNGSMMVVGGQDTRSSSPSQVLGMYRSYSGGAGARPLDDSHLRMSVGSFGGHSVLGYNRSYGDPLPPPSNYYPGPVRSHEGSDRMPHFYVLLRKFNESFKDCTFLLPGVKLSLMDSKDSDRKGESELAAHGDEPSDQPTIGHPSHGVSGAYGEPSPQDIEVARRRVESSVCAFGGNLRRGREALQAQSNREAIFRGKGGSDDKNAAAVTPSSTDASGGTNSQLARRRAKYENELSSRYYENESRLSWEFEENPPVEIPLKDETDIEATDGGHTSVKTEHTPLKDEKGSSEDDLYCLSVNDDGDGASSEKGSSSPQAKMRYRCKLCGQPKQNHRCPYQQALARSIGAMVYPAVNAFTADEPGTIAAPLSEMNNFIDIQKDGEPSPLRPSPERMRHIPSMSTTPILSSAQVTPETMRSSSRQPRSSNRHGNKKRMYSHMKDGSTDHGDLLFVIAMELKPEQFRIVSQSKSRKLSDAYIYPALPLPYEQRKRLSDNLFSLSNEVPNLTDECAQVLREAREKDLWDLAVAELMTQVIVIIHCSDRDYRFEGLRQYLLTLGIAC